MQHQINTFLIYVKFNNNTLTNSLAKSSQWKYLPFYLGGVLLLYMDVIVDQSSKFPTNGPAAVVKVDQSPKPPFKAKKMSRKPAYPKKPSKFYLHNLHLVRADI